MTRVMNDTHPKIERKMIELLRAAGPDRRGQMASALTNQCRWRSREAITRTRPHLSIQERELFLLKLLYGREIADRVREHLEHRGHADDAR